MAPFSARHASRSSSSVNPAGSTVSSSSSFCASSSLGLARGSIRPRRGRPTSRQKNPRRDPGRHRPRCGTRSWSIPAARAKIHRCCLLWETPRLWLRAANSSVSHCSTMPKPRNSRSIAVKVTVVVGVARHEAVAADAVIGLDPLDHVHGKRNLA